MSAHTPESQGRVPESFRRLLDVIGKAPNRLEILAALQAYENDSCAERMTRHLTELESGPISAVPPTGCSILN